MLSLAPSKIRHYFGPSLRFGTKLSPFILIRAVTAMLSTPISFLMFFVLKTEMMKCDTCLIEATCSLQYPQPSYTLSTFAQNTTRCGSSRDR